MEKKVCIIRDALPTEFKEIGELMVDVYSNIEGFPDKDKQPNYYKVLLNVGDLTKKTGTRLLIAKSQKDELYGGLVYFENMEHYGAAGNVAKELNSAGFRLLAVNPISRGKGIGKKLIEYCIQLSIDSNKNQLIIHSTKSMNIAWKMYEKIGFTRSPDLDFMQKKLQVFGFRLLL